jgi:hypothetical protein
MLLYICLTGETVHRSDRRGMLLYIGQISVDFYYVPVGGRGGAGEGGMESILYGYS